MREIIFRGKSMFTGEWVCGDLLHFNNSTCIREVTGTIEDVRKDSIGQYTGLKDKNGKKIFEGDILRTAKGYIQMVLWVDYYSAFVAEIPSGDRPYLIDSSDEVIGNIHDNPELLEVPNGKED